MIQSIVMYSLLPLCLFLVCIGESISVQADGCLPTEFMCKDGSCINSTAYCDEFPDCPDGSDEIKCGGITCSEALHRCSFPNRTQICIPETDMCDCGQPTAISYGNVTLDDATETHAGAAASVLCDEGYFPKKAKINCSYEGLWDEASCIGKDCGTLSTIPHGTITLVDFTNTSYGAAANVKCDVGFETNTSPIYCLSSTLWQLAACTAVDCGNCTTILHGTISLVDKRDSTYGAAADVICDEGFKASVSTVYCLSSAKWQTASCEAVDMSYMPTDNTTTIIIVVVVFGTLLVVQLIFSVILHIVIYRKYTENVGIVVCYVALCSVPVVGFVFIVYRWRVLKFRRWRVRHGTSRQRVVNGAAQNDNNKSGQRFSSEAFDQN